MTVLVETPEGPQEIKMVQTILEHRHGLYNPRSTLCFITMDKTFEFPRDTKWQFVETGLDPYFHDAKGQPIQSRLNPPSGPPNPRMGSAHGSSKVSGPRKVAAPRMKSCLFCSKPTENSEMICDGCMPKS